MTWDEMKPEERNRLIHEKVMHKPIFCPGKIQLVQSPMAWYCDECLQSWVLSEVEDYHTFMHFIRKIPPYAQSMDAAWLVVRMLNNPDSPAFPDYQDYARFINALEEIVGSNLFFDLFYCDKDGDHLTPERLCKAALIAVGVKLE